MIHRHFRAVRRIFRSLRVQMLLGGALTVLIATVFVAGLDFSITVGNARRETRNHMFETAVALQSALEHVEPGKTQEILTGFAHAVFANPESAILVVDPQAIVVASTHPQDLGKPVETAIGHSERGIRDVLAGRLRESQEQMTHRSVPVNDLSLPLHGDPADPTRITGALHYEEPYAAYTTLLRELLLQYLLSDLILMVLLVGPLWFFLDRRILRPVRRVLRANRALAEGHREAMMIPEAAIPDDEIGDTMRSRNEMLGRLTALHQELNQRLKELAELDASAAVLSQSIRTEEVLQRILDKVVEITHADAAAISLVNAETQRLVLQTQRGFSLAWLEENAHRSLNCLCPTVAQQGVPVCVNDENPGALRLAEFSCVREGYRELCVVPLQAEGRVMGVMSLHSRNVRSPMSHEMALLSAVGSQIGVAVGNIYLYQETQRLSVTDPLTGLLNRRALEERFQNELRRAQRYQHPLSAIMADIDHFKNYNDTHGHLAGDAILRQVADLLRTTVRETDAVARYGGEEFLILLPETSKGAAIEVAEKIRAAVQARAFPFADTQPGGGLTLSLGVATFSDAWAEGSALIHRADQALYEAKRSGRNRVSSA